MTTGTKRVIGASLIALPFIVMLIASIIMNGIMITFAIIVGVAGLSGIIGVGVNLLYSKDTQSADTENQECLDKEIGPQ